MARLKIILSALWGALLEAAKKTILKKALMALVGSTTGATAWIVSFVFDYLWDSVGIPLANLAKRKGLLIIDKKTGQINALKMKEAVSHHDENAFNDIIDNS